MEIKKRKKKFGLSSSSINIDLNIEIIEQILLYIFINPETNPYVNRKSLSNIYQLFDIMDKRPYETDEVMISRISFIQKILYMELKENIYTFEILISKGLDGSHKDEIQNSIIPFIKDNEDALSMEEIKYINKFVSEHLRYAFLFKHKEIIESKFEDLVLNRYESISDIVNDLENSLMELSNDIRRSKLDEENNSKLDFTDVNFEDNLIEIVNKLKKPTNFLKTGIINLNKMLNGGFESGRLYMFMGITGGFKSGILLNILYWLKKYNLNYKTNDPEKIPTILYITQENSVQETVERLWGIGCSNKDIRTMSNTKIIDSFKSNDFKIDEKSNVSLSIMYKGNKTISTDDLYNIYDDYSDEGKEIICVIHDYTKRIRPSQPTGDLRIDLSNVVDEETLFAKTKNIPFITAAQLNRKAMEIIEEAIQSGKKNAIDKLGASNVGESWGMMENADWVGLINIAEVKDESHPENDKKYIEMKQIKIRGKKTTSFNSFVQPFFDNDGMKIIDDEETGKSQSIQSLETFSSSSFNNDNNKIPNDFNNAMHKKRNKTTINRRKLKEKVESITEEINDDLSEFDE